MLESSLSTISKKEKPYQNNSKLLQITENLIQLFLNFNTKVYFI